MYISFSYLFNPEQFPYHICLSFLFFAPSIVLRIQATSFAENLSIWIYLMFSYDWNQVKYFWQELYVGDIVSFLDLSTRYQEAHDINVSHCWSFYIWSLG